ncbi:MAG: UPF0182 family protein [Acidimicrobiales bacterium]
MTTVRHSIRTSRVRVLAVVGLGIVLVLLFSADGIATAYTEWLWFNDLQLGSVWTRRVGTQIGLVAAFSAAFFVLLWGNLLLADRLAPSSEASSPDPPVAEQDLVVRYQRLIRGRAGRIRLVLCVVLALVAGGNTAGQWQEWLLFRNAVAFQQPDRLFHRDIGFYLFRLPFLTFVLDWLFAALILTLVVVTVAHYLNGGIRPSGPAGRMGSGVGSGVKAHLSALLAALAVVRAVGYWFDRFQLVNSTRGAFDGALATAVNIQWPAYNLLVLVSLFVAALFLANLRRQGWGLPMVAIGLWVASHALVGSAFPALYQRLRVESQASTRESEYVGRNIEATRFAYGLDNTRLTVEPVDYRTGITEAEVADFAPVLSTVPLLDPSLAQDSFTLSQGEAAYYRFSDPLDVDRYEIDGQVRPVVLSARSLDLAVSQVSQGWESQHILFTHGYGAALAAGWEVDPSGRPRFLVRELGEVAVDPSLQEEMAQPRIYFGENFGGYAIVNAARDEVDFAASTAQSAQTRYEDQQGQGGVPLGGVVRRAAFALRFRQLDPLIAPVLTPDSEVIFHRDITERIRTIAPFLRLDSNPYPVLAQGRIFWVVDAYTTSDHYPYAQRVSADETDLAGTELAGGLNYVRNSVKAVVDAFDGTVRLYKFDENDPVLATWDRAFPGLFRDSNEIPADLMDNLRYPEDIFRLQTTIWSTYVVENAQQLIQGETAWSVAAQPRSEAAVGEGEAGITPVFMKPQYLLTRLPGQQATEYVLQRAFVPRSVRSGSSTTLELTGVMVARSDPGHLGELVLYTIPSAAGVKAPDFVHSEIRKDDQLTDFVKEKLGSVVSFGEMTMLLMNDTVVYVRPVYVEAASVNAVPELSRVIVVNGDNVQMGATLQEAMARLAAEQAGTSPPAAQPATDQPATGQLATGQPSAGEQARSDQSPAYDPDGKSLTELLADADQLLTAADGAEAQGDAARAADLRGQARTALDAARNLLGGSRNGAVG